MTSPTQDQFLTIDDIAAMLKVKKVTVQRWCRQGMLPSSKIGKEYRVRRDDFENWFNGNSTAKEENNNE